MKKYILMIVAFAVFNQLHSQSETSISAAKFHKQISQLIQKASQESFNNSRSFNLHFDTLYLLLADHPSPAELVTTVIVEYDDLERIKTAKIVNIANEDNYNYYYNYIGNQTRFSRLDFYLVENGIETYDGFQVHLYNQKNTLVSSKEYNVDGSLSYADSLHITYNGSNQITEYAYHYFQEGAWHLGKGTYDIQYNSGLVTSYYAVFGSITQQGEDTIQTYLYEDVIFNKNDPSYLFRDIFEFYSIDSAGVDDFFFSREDASKYFQHDPIQYNKYRIDGVSHPDTLIETSVFTETDHVETLVRDQYGDELYSINYYFDNEDRLTGLVNLKGGDTILNTHITYNEHDRIGTIIYKFAMETDIENNTYITNNEGNLIEYRQDIEFDQLGGSSTILRFGFKKGASSRNFSNSFINVFPNPADNYLQLEIPVISASSYDLQITDMAGKIVLSGSGNTKNKNINLNIEQLLPGVYYLNLTSGNERFISRFIKR